jgi:hypothetical protein
MPKAVAADRDTHRGRDVGAAFHYAPAARWTALRAAVELL